MNNLGFVLDKKRIESGYKTMASLAKDSGINASMLSKYRNNQSKPELKTLKVLARAIGMPYMEMVKAADYREEEMPSTDIEEQQEIDDSIYQNLVEICKKIYDEDASLRTAFLNLLEERFEKGYLHEMLVEHEEWIQYLNHHKDPRLRNYIKEDVYNAHAKRICLRIVYRMLDRDYTWIIGFNNDLKNILDQNGIANVKSPCKLDIAEMKKNQFILTLDGKEFTDLEVERIINFTRFERRF